METAVVATVALHPNDAPRQSDLDASLDEIAQMAQDERVRGIGEKGERADLAAGAQLHLGIYAYLVEANNRMTALQPGELELTEKLEQLRALQAGMKLVVDVATVAPPAGIDTQADLDRVRALLPKS